MNLSFQTHFPPGKPLFSAKTTMLDFIDLGAFMKQRQLSPSHIIQCKFVNSQHDTAHLVDVYYPNDLRKWKWKEKEYDWVFCSIQKM
jgi:hypothetical protein